MVPAEQAGRPDLIRSPRLVLAHIWAVGTTLNDTTSAFQTLIEQWNGTSWTVVASPSPGVSQSVLNEAAADPSFGQAWAVGFTESGTLIEFNP